MKRILAALVIAFTVAALGPNVGSLNAREPSYLILRAAARPHKGHAFYPGRGYEVRTHAYAYGWFGARPRCHLERSTGYNSGYIQWSKQ
jgi:hypothetical protein